MLPQMYPTLILVFAVSIIRMSATRLEQDDDDRDEQMTRFFFFHPKTPSGALTVSNSRLVPDSPESNEICRPNVCHTGRCISMGTGYYCQCSEHRYGQHCEKRLKRRNVFKRQSLQKFFKQTKRNVYRPDNNDEEDDGRAYYDFKNGIYF